MSLVNLAHVLSHLQNSSGARLGLTSIPYSKLHLSLSLLLHKQGFFSHVKLGGPSPPASCFPPGVRDSHAVTAHPHQHAPGSIHSPESALQRVISGPGPITEEILRQEGFGADAIDFALQERFRSAAQLEQQGYAARAADFLLQHHHLTPEQLDERKLDAAALDILRQHEARLATAREEVTKWYGDPATLRPEENETVGDGQITSAFYRRRTALANQVRSKVREHLLREGFSVETLRYFAGPQHSLRTERDLARDGLTINAMGLDIPNQPFNPPPAPESQDPWGLETEGVVTQANRASRRLWLGLKYWEGEPVLRKAQLLSKPTKRIWLNAKELGDLTRGR